MLLTTPSERAEFPYWNVTGTIVSNLDTLSVHDRASFALAMDSLLENTLKTQVIMLWQGDCSYRQRDESTSGSKMAIAPLSFLLAVLKSHPQFLS